jgi:hypothetical protein
MAQPRTARIALENQGFDEKYHISPAELPETGRPADPNRDSLSEMRPAARPDRRFAAWIFPSRH